MSFFCGFYWTHDSDYPWTMHDKLTCILLLPYLLFFHKLVPFYLATTLLCISINAGSPNITSLTFNAQSYTLTCNSTGGPATTVTWKRDGVVITLNATYQQTKRVVDPVAGTYQTVLTIDPSVSPYNCTVENARGRSSMTVIVGKLTLKYTSCCYPHYIGTWLLLCMR